MSLPLPRTNIAAGRLLDQTPAAARETLRRWVEEQGHPAYRAGQIVRRLWQAPLESWSAASDLPLALRAELEATFPLPRLTADTIQQSTDGTRKYLWRLEDNEAIESVLIPSGNRRTLCISSQAGCALGCTFCATGRMGFRRNLTPFEIAGQIRELVLRDPSEKPTNIVFMGMGEPLLNWASVDATLSILNSPDQVTKFANCLRSVAAAYRKGLTSALTKKIGVDTNYVAAMELAAKHLTRTRCGRPSSCSPTASTTSRASRRPGSSRRSTASSARARRSRCCRSAWASRRRVAPASPQASSG